MILISSDPKLSSVASQIERSEALAKIKKQFLEVPAPSRAINQFFSISRWSENTHSLNRKISKLKLSFLLASLLVGSASFATSAPLSDFYPLSNYKPLGNCVYQLGSGVVATSIATAQTVESSVLTYMPNNGWLYTDWKNVGATYYNPAIGATMRASDYNAQTLMVAGNYCQHVTACKSTEVLGTNGVCYVPKLSDYDKNPQDCSKSGGYFYSAFGIESGGTYYTVPLPFGGSINLKQHFAYSTHCGTFIDMAGQVASNILPMLQMAVPFFRSAKLLKMASYARSEYYRNKPTNTTAQNDLIVNLPKLPAPASPSMKAIVPIVEKPIPTAPNPTTGTVGPTREPDIIPDTNYQYIDDSFIPETTAGDPIVDYSVIDRFNSINNATTSNAPLTQLIPESQTATTQVKETFDFSKIISNSQAPQDIASVPATTSKSVSFSGADPIDTYTTTKNYPDGSSLSQVVKINRATKEGFASSTTLAKSGESTTLSFPFVVPTYNGVLSGADIIKPPVNQTFSTPTTSPTASNTVTPSSSVPAVASTMTNPDAISGQDPATIINAKMPNYKFASSDDITLFKVDSINELNNNFKDMFDNIVTQLSTAKSTFDTTKDLISGGWTPPIIPAGACGQFMAFDFHRQHVDLCPPMAQQTAKIAPLVTLLLTIAGIVFAIRIYLSALRD